MRHRLGALALLLLLASLTPASAQLITGGATGSGSGSVTNIATTGPISGGPITTTGTISCPTCATASAMTTNTIPKAGGNRVLIDSLLTDNGTTLTYGGASGVVAPAYATNGAASGALALSGSSSGTVTQTVQAAAGTPTVTWGTNSGTPAVSATAPLTITSATGNILLPATMKSRGIPFTIGDPSGSALTVASTTTDYLTVPFTCTISAWNLLVDAGTVTVKIWKIATGTAIPTSSNSITPNGLPITTATASRSTTNVSEWSTTAVTANDILAMNVTAVATAKYVQGVLQCDF